MPKLLKERTLTVVPGDDCFFRWIISGDAEATLSNVLERSDIPDHLAADFGTALANVAQMAARR
ncbi:MAG: hypothetical protein ABW061_23275 [Polyangiaceae bacterium]